MRTEIRAIIYTSNTGTTEKYARLIGTRTGLPVLPMEQAAQIEPGQSIIYLGWVMASEIKGYKAAAKRWDIQGVCAVGMGGTGTQEKEIREKNELASDMPVFTLQGGFDITKLHGVYKMMMKVMIKAIGKGLAEKEDRTEDEERMYQMTIHGGDYVSEENLEAVYRWYDSTYEF